VLIRFAGTGTDELELVAVGNSDLIHQRIELVMDFPGVSGCF